MRLIFNCLIFETGKFVFFCHGNVFRKEALAFKDRQKKLPQTCSYLLVLRANIIRNPSPVHSNAYINKMIHNHF